MQSRVAHDGASSPFEDIGFDRCGKGRTRNAGEKRCEGCLCSLGGFLELLTRGDYSRHRMDADVSTGRGVTAAENGSESPTPFSCSYGNGKRRSIVLTGRSSLDRVVACSSSCQTNQAVNVLGVVLRSARELWPVVALMLLVMFVFTVLGMQLFGADLNPHTAKGADDEYALKLRFDTFFWSFVQVTVARKRSSDQWTNGKPADPEGIE